MSRAVQICVDCDDADALAAFWALALGYEVQAPPGGFATWPEFLEANDIPVPPPGSISGIVDPDGAGPRVLFQRVPEAKETKNRLHLDIRAGEDRDATVARLVAAGGAEISRHDEMGSSWVVMTDPEGNELCVTS